MAGIIIFLICSLVFSVCLAQNTDQASVDTAGSYSLPPSFGPIFYLNSSFPLIWYNNDSNGRTLVSEDGSTTIRAIISRKESVEFECGFYCIGSCTYYLFSVAIVGGGNHSVVWSVNIGHPVKEGATLQLTLDGELELRNSDGDHVWSTNTLGKSVVGMNITEWGNLVLFNNAGSIVWQSYDYPTDTLLVGQRLREGQKLISSSPNFWARGLYIAALKLAIGFAAYIGGKGQPQMYYQLVPNQTSITSRGPNYAELQQGGFLVNFGTSQSMFKIDPFNFSSTVCIAYIKLGSDGHLKIFHHSNANGSSEIVDMVTHDLGECQHPRHCGEYCFCRQGQCSCPIGIDRVRYFKQTQSQNGEQYQQQTQLQIPHMGCSRISSLSCPPPFDQKHHLVEVENVTYFILIDSDAAFPNINDIERCKEICLLNCSCGAVFFRYNNNASDGYCYIPSTVLTIRGEQIPNHSFASASYVKVQIPYKASNGQMEGNVPNSSPPASPSRNRKNLMAIIAGSCAGYL